VSGLLPFEVDASSGGRSDGGGFVLAQLGKPLKLAPGKSAKVTVSLPIDSTMAGSCYMTVQLDPANTLNDVNTANNSFTSLLPIVIH
jgi:hypothetical protein